MPTLSFPGWRALAVLAASLGPAPTGAAATDSAVREIARVDLTAPFHPRSAQVLVATQGPPTVDYGDNPAPGAVRLCVEKGAAPGCATDSALSPSRALGDQDDSWAPHELRTAKPVYPRGASGPPLLLIVTASLHAGDGDQRIVTQLFRYDRAADQFHRVYEKATGANNNQDVRFVASGPLRGDVISVEPTSNAPFAYWVEVNTLAPGGAYRRTLRYRSATRYGDGNPLAVIDSETPNIERRLGVWKPGLPPPLPTGAVKACVKPRLKQMELWCD